MAFEKYNLSGKTALMMATCFELNLKKMKRESITLKEELNYDRNRNYFSSNYLN